MSEAGTTDGDFAAKDGRRISLILKKYDRDLDADEQAELRVLQEEIEERCKVATPEQAVDNLRGLIRNVSEAVQREHARKRMAFAYFSLLFGSLGLFIFASLGWLLCRLWRDWPLAG